MYQTLYRIFNTTTKTIHKICNKTIHPLCTKLIHIHQKEFQKLQRKFPIRKFINIYTKSTKNQIFFLENNLRTTHPYTQNQSK